MTHNVLAITLGDPGGIGPEVTLKAIRHFRRRAPLILIGSLSNLEHLNKQLNTHFKFQAIQSGQLKRGFKFQKNIVPVLDVKIPGQGSKFVIGKVSAVNGLMAIESVKEGVDLCLSGAADALVTAPINKAAIQKILPNFDGHTEFLKHRSGAKRVAMMFSAGRLRMSLVTMHLPLKDVSKALKQGQIQEKIELTHDALKRFFGIKKPRIGVSALNPHGGEFGDEEARIIAPAVKACSRWIPNVFGPIPGDEIFRELWEGKWDAVIAMYHDQGLAPFKMVAFRNGVNLTLGLPFIRTSPDHGTAFDIAYQNKADYRPMLSAMELALELANKKK